MDLVGSTLGSCEIIKEIGRGGMAVVYLGHQPALQRQVAVKVLLTGLTHDPSFVERFRREARLVARLNHPNIVRIYTVDHTEHVQYLVMDYADAGTLQQRLASGRSLDWPVVVSITDQVAQALDYAHGQGIIHRDVKPSNILLTQDGRAMLTDFGIAVAAEQTRLTLAGGSWGTPEYMAPEQALGHKVSPATDIYALGAVAYEMATGQAPFRADTPMALLHQHVYNTPPPPRGINRSLAPPAEQAILRALAKDPKARFPSAGAFLQALQGRDGAKPPSRDQRRRFPAWVWALLVVLALGTFLFFAFLAIGAILPGPATPAVKNTPSPTLVSAVTQLHDTSRPPAATAIPVLTWTPSPPPFTPTWTASPWPTDTPTPPSPVATVDPMELAVKDAIWRYAELKALATGPAHDVSQLDTVLVGEALRDQMNAAQWQRDHGAHYVTIAHWSRIEWIQQVDATHVEAMVSKNETLLYYPEGWTTPSARRSCDPCEYQVLYKLELIRGQWYIAEKEVQD
jgi:serine/threonine-protein kinase